MHRSLFTFEGFLVKNGACARDRVRVRAALLVVCPAPGDLGWIS